jgi:hypothetical protein
MNVTHWQALGTVAIASSLVGCGALLPFEADTLQTWEFTLKHSQPSLSNVAVAECKPNVCDAASWEILDEGDFGCSFYLDFAVQFSGSQVRFHTAKNGSDTTCSGVSALISGTGTANGPYPSAEEASGSVTITTQSKFLGQSGFTVKWSGRRVE